MHAEQIPTDILITALASRLADLQTSRVDPEAMNIAPPTPSEGADRRALVAGLMLRTLGDRLSEENDGEYVTLDILAEQIRESLPDLELAELVFSARFLDAPRTIQYQVQDDVNARAVKSWSALVRHQARYSRIRLSAAGKLFLQVLRHRNDWLFQNKQVESLEQALNAGLFSDIPKLCAEITVSLRGFAEQLTQLRENGSSKDLAASYLERRDYFGDMLKKCSDSVFRSLELLRTEDLRERFLDWEARHKEPQLSLVSLRQAARQIHQLTEGCARLWRQLLDELSARDRSRLGVVDFSLGMKQLLNNPPVAPSLRALLVSASGWATRPQLASHLNWVGALEPLVVKPREQPLVYDQSIDSSALASELQGWLLRHQQAILRALEKGPMRLSDLLGDYAADLPIQSLQDLAGAIGLYTIEEPLRGRVPLVVMLSEDALQTDIAGHNVRLNDLVLGLAVTVNEGGAHDAA